MGGLVGWGDTSGRASARRFGPVGLRPDRLAGRRYNVARDVSEIVTAGEDPAQEMLRRGGSAMALEFAPGTTRIGWIGTGVMGSSMCGHLMAAGYAATVFNRTPDKARPLVE